MQLKKLSLSLVLVLSFLEMAHATMPGNCLEKLLNIAHSNQQNLVTNPISTMSLIQSTNFARRNALLRYVAIPNTLNQQITSLIQSNLPQILEVSAKLGQEPARVVEFLLKDSEISASNALAILNRYSRENIDQAARHLHLTGANKLKLLNLDNINLASIAEHAGDIHEAHELFEISHFEFVVRLSRANITLDEFFSLVAEQRLQNIQLEEAQTVLDRFYVRARSQRQNLFHGVSQDLTTLNNILGQEASLESVQNTINHVKSMSMEHAKRLYKQMSRAIHLRNVASPGYSGTVRNNLVLSNLATIFGHYQNQGLTGLGSLFTNLNAFTVLEVILSNSSTKDAAYLMANPEILRGARLAARSAGLNNQQLVAVKTSSQRVSDFVFRLGKNSVDVLRNTARNAPGLASSSFVISLIPMTVGVAATGMQHGAANILTEGVFKSALISFYIGTSSNLRYNIIFDKIMPAINSTNLDPKAKTALITSFFLANLMAGPYTYSYLESYANEFRNYVLSDNN